MTNLPDDSKFVGRLRNAGPGAGTDACSLIGALRIDAAGRWWRYTAVPGAPWQQLLGAYPATFPPGPPGPKGDQGDPGPPGPAGSPALPVIKRRVGTGPTVAGTGLIPWPASVYTQVVDPGTYQIRWSCVFTSTSTGVPGIQFTVTSGVPTQTPGGTMDGHAPSSAGSKQVITAEYDEYVHPGGAMTLSAAYRRAGSTAGNVIGQEMSYSVWRSA